MDIIDVTIATHNGTAQSQPHNRREPSLVEKEAHINPNGDHEIWVDETVRHAYTRIFGDAVLRYNEKQKRDDRKVLNYYNDISKDSKKHLAYEMIIGIYAKTADGTMMDATLAKEILREFVDDWKKRNPNLEMIGAYWHNDERGEPHVHIDYIPVARNCSRGLETQNSLTKALNQQGFKTTARGNTAQMQWEHRENAYLEDLCKQRGLNVLHPAPDGVKHTATALYEAQQALKSTIDHNNDLSNNNNELEKQITQKKKELAFIQKQTQKALEQKSKALSLKKTGESAYTYDKGLADGIKELVSECKHDVEALSKVDYDIQSRYQEAELIKKQAEEAKAQAEKLQQHEERLIQQEAQRIADKRFKEFTEQFLGKGEEGYTTRLEQFVGTLTLSDGENALDVFRAEEQTRADELRQSWDELF